MPRASSKRLEHLPKKPLIFNRKSKNWVANTTEFGNSGSTPFAPECQSVLNILIACDAQRTAHRI
jgi:hypothetical protein